MTLRRLAFSLIFFTISVISTFILLLVFGYYALSDRTSSGKQFNMLLAALPELSQKDLEDYRLFPLAASDSKYCSGLRNALSFEIFPQCFELFISDDVKPALREKIITSLSHPCEALTAAGQDVDSTKWQYFKCGKGEPLFGKTRIALITISAPPQGFTFGSATYFDIVEHATSVQFIEESR